MGSHVSLAEDYAACFRNREKSTLPNGFRDSRIDTCILRAGGAAALYAQGVPFDIIQRWGRWKPLAFRQYFRREATSLNKLSGVFVKSDGPMGSLRLMSRKQNGGAYYCE